MLKELFESISKSAIDGAIPHPVKLDLPNGVTRVFYQDRDHEDLIAIPDRRHTLGSVDQVAPFVAYHTETRAADPVVWYDDTGVRVVLNDKADSRRNDVAFLAFKPTEEFAYVHDMAQEEPEFTNAKTMIQLFRRQLWDAFASEAKRDDLVKKLRTVRFEDDEQSSLGTVKRSIKSLADGEDMFPEQVELSLRPFDDPALMARFRVKCHFEVNPDTKTFALIPIMSELKSASDGALAALQELLAQTVRCPIFRGAP